MSTQPSQAAGPTVDIRVGDAATTLTGIDEVTSQVGDGRYRLLYKINSGVF